MKPRAATSACAGFTTGSWPSTVISTSASVSSPRSAVTWARVTISTELSRTAWTVRWWARNASRRCTRVIDRATGSRCCAQSNALSPPPTMTTSLPAYGWNDGTKNSRPRPSQPSPAGSGRGLNLPMPAVMMTAPAVISVPSSSPIVTESPSWRSVRAVRSRKYSGCAVEACATSPSTRSRPFTVGKPATSRIAFSGYIAVIWPPSSGSESTTATRRPRNPA